MEATKTDRTPIDEALANPTTLRWFGRIEGEVLVAARTVGLALSAVEVHFADASDDPTVKAVVNRLRVAETALAVLDGSDESEANLLDDLRERIRAAQH